MIGIVLEQFRKIENSSRTLEHVFAGAVLKILFHLVNLQRELRGEGQLMGCRLLDLSSSIITVLVRVVANLACLKQFWMVVSVNLSQAL